MPDDRKENQGGQKGGQQAPGHQGQGQEGGGRKGQQGGQQVAANKAGKRADSRTANLFKPA